MQEPTKENPNGGNRQNQVYWAATMKARKGYAGAAPSAKALQPEKAKPGRAAVPLRFGAKVIVEANDRSKAAEAFEHMLNGGRRPDIKTAKLAPALFFAQAQPTGRYWLFTR